MYLVNLRNLHINATLHYLPINLILNNVSSDHGLVHIDRVSFDFLVRIDEINYLSEGS